MEAIKDFGIIFISLILEGFPFLILGAFISSIIQLFISEDTLSKFASKNKFLALLGMAVAGIVFPVCECAIVPIVRRLIKKGLPINMAVTFMTAVPIVNPVVFMSTYYAFLGHPLAAFLRLGLGIICSIFIGFLVGEVTFGNPLKEEHKHKHEHEHCHHENKHQHNCSCCEEEKSIKGIIGHVSEEFYEIGRFFIIGAALSSVLQSFVPRQYILAIGGGKVSSIIVMMLLAFVLSICSETDAFIARTFLTQFTSSSILAFLIFGPMIDIKNTIMLLGNFKLSFVIKLVFIIIAVCFIAAATISMFPIVI